MSKEGRDAINKTENSFIQIFCVHMIWIISVLSLIPKGEIVGIKLVFPSVTTLSLINIVTKLITLYSSSSIPMLTKKLQCLPSD